MLSIHATPSAPGQSWASFQDGPATPPPETSELMVDADPITLQTTPVVAVIGCGYVGSHLVQIFGQHYSTIAFDVNAKRIKEFSQECRGLSQVRCTTDASELVTATHYLVSVPTLLTPDKKQVDTTHIRSALATVLEYAREGSTIVIESSVAVGMTRSLLESLVTARGIHAGMSPERVDPGRAWPALEDVPKIISALTPSGLASIRQLYKPAFAKLVEVSSPEVAEMTKLYENCQRMVCIAFANEMADSCQGFGIDAYEVARAAATKPYGFMPFTPGLGVGGHCIPVNPSYLLTNCTMPVLQLATERMHARPDTIAEEFMQGRQAPRVLVAGVAFKPGQSVLSHSPSLQFARRLQSLGAEVSYMDPLVPQSAIPDIKKSFRFDADIVVIGMLQTGIDFHNIPSSCEVITYADLEAQPPSFLRRESRCR